MCAVWKCEPPAVGVLGHSPSVCVSVRASRALGPSCEGPPTTLWVSQPSGPASTCLLILCVLLLFKRILLLIQPSLLKATSLGDQEVPIFHFLSLKLPPSLRSGVWEWTAGSSRRHPEFQSSLPQAGLGHTAGVLARPLAAFTASASRTAAWPGFPEHHHHPCPHPPRAAARPWL